MGMALGIRGAVSIGPLWAEGQVYGLGQLWSIEDEKTGKPRGKAESDSVLRERHRTSITEENRQNTDAREGVSPPSEALGPPSTPNVGQSSGPADPVATALAQVELTLAKAIDRATEAGEWATVRILASELEARRKSREAQRTAGVTSLESARARKNGDKP
jgi:hypothetical protein